MSRRAPQRACVGCGKRTSGYDGGMPKCNDCRGIRRLVWADVLDHAAGIVLSYDTGVTLRQLFYRLVADGTMPNLRTQYTHLSENTAKARRNGWFPDLIDQTSRIELFRAYDSPEEALVSLRNMYRRHRTEGQPWTIMLAVEKAGMSGQLDDWFTDPLGIPHVALGGYASQTLCDEVREYVQDQGRPAVLIYAGDLDPSGEDIDRDFIARTDCWAEVIRVALGPDQVEGLPESIEPEVMEKLERDPRARAFADRHGDLKQYELDALPPDEIRDLYQEAIDGYWDADAHQAVLDQEDADRQRLDDTEVAEADE